jgi:hypothetical protein
MMFDNETPEEVLERMAKTEWYIVTITGINAEGNPDCAQQFVNYLDSKYGGERYNLQPLRGQDWAEISEYKKDTVKSTAEFVIAHDPKIISTHEIYEIYKIIQGERNGSMSKQIASVTENIRVYMEAGGYSYAKDAVIHGGARTNIFRKGELVRGDLRDYEEDFGKYISEEMVNGRPMRRLRGVEPVTPPIKRQLSPSRDW